MNARAMYQLKAASCSLLLLLLTLALVTSSLLVARYAVKASSWWLSLLAVTVCLLALCTWVQLAASKSDRWRSLLARHAAQQRRCAGRQARARALARAGRAHRAHCRQETEAAPVRVANISESLESGLAVPQDLNYINQPPPPPYALSDLPPSYGVTSASGLGPGPDYPEPPPPYSVAIKNDIQVTLDTRNADPSDTDVEQLSRTRDRNRRPFMWY